MKPGRKDTKLDVLISGAELSALKELIPYMAESYGLDHRIERYRGARPIGLYWWDIDCILNALECGLSNVSRSNAQDTEALSMLYERLLEARIETWGTGV